MPVFDMKRFVIRVLFIAVIICGVDKMIGAGLSYLDKTSRVKTGTGYIMNKVNHDILVFGSSRAYRHYDTRIITDSLGLSCYNCGKSGQGFIYNYALLRVLMEKYTPNLIIYDFYPTADLAYGDNTRYITDLRPYRKEKGVMDIIVDVDPSEKYKTISSMYCYNYICNEIILNYFRPNSGEKSINGFVSTKKIFNPQKTKTIVPPRDSVDSLKLKYAEKFIQLAKNTKFVIVISPYWDFHDFEYVRKAKELADKYSVPFYDFSSNKDFAHNNEYFFDTIHMNDKGAERFTNELVKQIVLN